MTKPEPADPCREALEKITNWLEHSDSVEEPMGITSVRRSLKHARAALSTPNPLPALVEALEASATGWADIELHGANNHHRAIRLGNQARVALAKWKESNR